jgi:hypothetical protein
MAISTSNKPHWQDRLRHISNNRMIWYGDPGDDQYGFTIKEFTIYLQNAGFSIEVVKLLYPHRMLLEEIPLYRWALKQPWSHFVKIVGGKVTTE